MLRFSILAIVFSILTVHALAQEPVAEGFAAVDLNGREVSLEDLRGKVVVVNFWSTRCVICHDEIPKLNRMSDSFRGRDVAFLAVTLEQSARVEEYLRKNPFDFDVIPNGFGVLLKFAERDSEGRINMPYPSFFVIGPSGRIEFKTEGAGKTGTLTSVIQNLLSQKSGR